MERQHDCKTARLKEYMQDIDLNEYNYDLPAEKIAQYPVKERDNSKLLIYKQGVITQDTFSNIVSHIPANSLLVFNNTRVIRARILFEKVTGAKIEILCIEPIIPFEYELSFSSREPVVWKCIIGNLKKWKSRILLTTIKINKQQYSLTAERLQAEGDAWRIKFSWSGPEISFGEVIEAVGHIPLPPYINRKDEAEDSERYQTIYSSINGSVAAPTAGLHFTKKVFEHLNNKGIKTGEVTLHVGAGTFQPVKAEKISGHEMHCEHFFVSASMIDLLLENRENIIPVGTTSVRTLESLYWLGVKLLNNQLDDNHILSLGQWEAYGLGDKVSVKESMEALLKYLKENNLSFIQASTSLMITPGYSFKMINGIVTNFHQPKSSLLLLISAWTGNGWKRVYTFALENDFRFLSYGDSSLLLK
jgi:S-adenosylmethionine:tRNA ribosyltransferase-isomerase